MQSETDQRQRVVELTRSLYRDQVAEKQRNMPSYKKERASHLQSELAELEEEQRMADIMKAYAGEAAATKSQLEGDIMKLEYDLRFEREVSSELRNKLESRGLTVIDEFAPECARVRERRECSQRSLASRGSSAQSQRELVSATTTRRAVDGGVAYASGTRYPLPDHARYSPSKNSILCVAHPIEGDVLTREEVAIEAAREEAKREEWRRSRLATAASSAGTGGNDDDANEEVLGATVDGTAAYVPPGPELSLVVLGGDLSVEERASIILHGTYDGEPMD